MKWLLAIATTITITLTPSPTHSAPLPPDLLCYAVIGGRIINLEGIGGDCGERKSDGSVGEAAKPQPTDELTVRVSNINFNRVLNTQFSSLSATITNTSKVPVKITSVQYKVLERENGRQIESGGIAVSPDRNVLKPGQSVEIGRTVAFGGWVEIDARVIEAN